MVSSPEREVDEMVKSKATWQRLHLKQSTERSALWNALYSLTLESVTNPRLQLEMMKPDINTHKRSSNK